MIKNTAINARCPKEFKEFLRANWEKEGYKSVGDFLIASAMKGSGYKPKKKNSAGGRDAWKHIF